MADSREQPRSNKRGGFAPTLLLSGHQAPQLVDVDRRAVKLVQSLVEVTHTNFAEITRMAAIT